MKLKSLTAPAVLIRYWEDPSPLKPCFDVLLWEKMHQIKEITAVIWSPSTGWGNQSSWGNQQGYSMYQGYGGQNQGSYSGYSNYWSSHPVQPFSPHNAIFGLTALPGFTILGCHFWNWSEKMLVLSLKLDFGHFWFSFVLTSLHLSFCTSDKNNCRWEILSYLLI